jgi:predicted DNA-binding transcriptional regulator AlpA
VTDQEQRYMNIFNKKDHHEDCDTYNLGFVDPKLFQNRIWGTKEVAQYLGRSLSWVYKKTYSKASKPLPSYKLEGKGGSLFFIPEEVKEWVKTGGV